ncbi:hypothetical protein [Salibacterium sp. K-3]
MHRLLFFMIFALLLFQGCSSTSSIEETTEHSNELYALHYEGMTHQADSGFTLSFSIIAEDETREIDTSDIELHFPEEISDEQGNSYPVSGNTNYQQKSGQSHIMAAEQTFSGSLQESTGHLSVPVRMVIDNNTEEITFHDVSAGSFPLTREELTITDLDRNGRVFQISAVDHVSNGRLSWTLNVNGENVYPVFTNTAVNEDGTYEGSIEFSYEPSERFTLTVERNRPEEAAWEFPFVLPVD